MDPGRGPPGGFLAVVGGESFFDSLLLKALTGPPTLESTLFIEFCDGVG